MRRWAAWFVSWSVLFICLYLAARGAATYIWDLANRGTLSRIGAPLLDDSTKETYEWAAVALCFVLAFAIPQFRFRALARFEGAVASFASHRGQAILLCGLLPVLLRSALLPVLPIPEPLIADEFGYLLIADTFASGRLANPSHALWKFFESIYVLHQPAYASIYPVAPAIPLALAEMLHATPWLGVCLGAGLMCAVICWMLQAWLPPKWALLGGLLAVLRFTIVSPWMNTYWGGSVAAIGGALLIGALPRIIARQRSRDSLWFGLGLAILAQSRPYEGALLSIPLVIWLCHWLLRARCIPAPIRVSRVVAPLSACLLILFAATALYNWRVTGNVLTMPYSLHQKIYGTPQSFYWQAAITDAPGIYRQKDIYDVFQWQLEAREKTLTWSDEGKRLQSFWDFYLRPLLFTPLVLLPFLNPHRRFYVLLSSATLLLFGNTLYPFFFPHYAAPLCGVIVLLIVWGLRRLRAFRFRSHRGGLAVSRLFITMIGVSGLCTMAGGILQPWFITASNTSRSQAATQLGEGKHVVFVRYGDRHSFHYGVVFNQANIDNSQIVWAHDLGDANRELVAYYRDRDFWLYTPDLGPDSLVPFGDRPYISAITEGAGRRDDARTGVSPGAIAIMTGVNLSQLKPAAGAPLLGALPVHVVGFSGEYGAEFAPGPPALFKLTGRVASDGPSVDCEGHRVALLQWLKSDAQDAIAFQVPFDVAVGSARVTLRSGDVVTTKKIRVLPASPGIFQVRMSDSKLRGIVLRPDGSRVDLEHPAHRGDVLRLFATGLGRLNQPLIIGVANRGARMLSAAYASSMPGIVEIKFEVPFDTPPGPDVPLSVAAVPDGQPIFYSNKSALPVQ